MANNYKNLPRDVKGFFDMEAKESKGNWYEDDEETRKEFFEVRKYEH